MALRTAKAALALVAVAAWHAVLARVADRREATVDPDAAVVEHERNWYDYLRGLHAHHGDVEGDLPEHGDFRTGLRLWAERNYLRGYTLGDDVYVCPGTPRVVRVHQAGHAPSFGRAFDTLRRERRADGGLEDEPLRTLDVMMPGRFPHTLLRVRDPRGLTGTYEEWVAEGRIARR